MLDLAPITSTAGGFLRKYKLLEIWIKIPIVFSCQKLPVTFWLSQTSQANPIPQKKHWTWGFQKWFTRNLRDRQNFWDSKIEIRLACKKAVQPAVVALFLLFIPTLHIICSLGTDAKRHTTCTKNDIFWIASSRMPEIVGGNPTLSRKSVHLTFGPSTSNCGITCHT